MNRRKDIPPRKHTILFFNHRGHGEKQPPSVIPAQFVLDLIGERESSLFNHKFFSAPERTEVFEKNADMVLFLSLGVLGELCGK